MSEYGNEDFNEEDNKDKSKFIEKDANKNDYAEEKWEPFMKPREIYEDLEDQWEPVDPYMDELHKAYIESLEENRQKNKPYAYDKKEFIKDIRDLEKIQPHPEIHLIFTILEFSGLDPYKFTKYLELYGAHGPRDFFNQVLKQFRKFTDFRTFNKIRNFISEHIDNKINQKLAYNLLDELFQLRYVVEDFKLLNAAEFFLQFTEEENEFLRELGYDLSENPKPNSDWYEKGKWFWMNNKNINLYYQSVLAPFLILNPNLRREDFKNLGFSRFISKIEKLGVTYKILKKRNEHISVLKLREKFGRQYLIHKVKRAKTKLENIKINAPKSSSQSLRTLIFTFLNSKAGIIERGEFIPSLQNILSTSDKIKKTYKLKKFKKTSITRPVQHWIKNNENLPFENVTELKKHFLGKSLRTQLYQRLPTSDFDFKKTKLNILQNSVIKRSLEIHFKNLINNNYPIEAFFPKFVIFDANNNPKFVKEDSYLIHKGKKKIIQNPRASMLHIRGNTREKLKMSYINRNLITVLKNKNRLIILPKSNYFSMKAQSVFDYYKREQIKRPNNMHPDILGALLNHNKEDDIKTIAIEVPIWKKLSDGGYFYGHIDSISVRQNTIYIGDYKPNQEEVLRFLPQISAYGIILHNLFYDITKTHFRKLIDNFSDIKIKCISFTKNKAWLFDYDILSNDILKFVKDLNSIRNKPLMSIRLKSMDNPTPLYEDILKLLSN